MKNKIMRTMIVAAGCILMLAVPQWVAGASECTFPDLEFLLGTSCRILQEEYVYSEEFLCDAYTWDYPDGWDSEDDYLFALLACEHCSIWEWDAEEIEGYSGFVLFGENGEQTLIVSEFDGEDQVLVLVDAGMEIEKVELTENADEWIASVEEIKSEESSADDSSSSENSESTQNTENTQSTGTSGHWEWQIKEVDCPSCVGGWCSVCNGTGTYRLYGQTVACPIYCSSCNGKGTITQREYVYVSGY